MSCVYISKNGEKSVLHQQLNDVFKSVNTEYVTIGSFPTTNTKADEIYNYIHSDQFKEWFGDFTKVNINNPKIVDENGEPKLFGDFETGYYFENEKGYREYITGENSAFTISEQEQISKSLLYYFHEKLKDETKGGGLISYLSNSQNLEKEFESKKLRKIIFDYVNELAENEEDFDKIIKLNAIATYAEFFSDKIRQFYANLGIDLLDSKNRKLTEDEDPELDPYTGEEKIESDEIGLNLANSVDISPLKTASRVLKAYLSFIPEFEIVDGNVVEKREGLLNSNSFVPYEKVHNTLLHLFENLTQGSKTFDEFFQEFISKFDKLSKSDRMLWANYIKNDLVKKYNSGDINAVIQFMQGVALHHYSYVYGTFNENGGFSIRNASSEGSNLQRLLTQWNVAVIKNYNREFFKDLPGLAKEFNTLISNYVTQIENQEATVEDMQKDVALLINQNLRQFGIQTDISAIIDAFNEYASSENQDSVEGISDVVKYFLDFLQERDSLKTVKDLYNDNGTVKDIVKSNKFLKIIGNAELLYRGEMNTESIIRPKGQSYSYSKSAYLKERILLLKDATEKNSIISVLRQNSYYKTSGWLDYIQNNDDFDAHIFSHFKKERSGDRGSDNKDIKLSDELNMNINGLLRALVEDKTTKTKPKPLFRTITAGDKTKSFQLEGFSIIETGFENGSVNETTINKLFGYFSDEYNRANDVENEIQEIANGNKNIDQVLYYNTLDEKTIQQNSKKEIHLRKRPNGSKIYSIPSLSYDVYNEAVYSKNKNENQQFIYNLHERLVNKYGHGLYAKDGSPMFKGGIPKEADFIIKGFLTNFFNNEVNNAIVKMEEFNSSPNVVKGQPIIDSSIRTYYINNRKPKDIEKNKNFVNKAIYADYYVNQTFANIEFTKVFLGDPAYYKNEADFHKRVQATQIDGDKPIVKDGNETFSVVVTKSIFQKLPEEIRAEWNSLLSANELKAYENINIADAQAWITIDRWKDIQQSLGRWDEQKHGVIFRKMKNEEKLTNAEIEFILKNNPPQSVKGVYFNLEANGRPVYLKYSQSVLIPSLIKNSPLLTKMNDFMQENKIDELVTNDGIKAGIPTQMLNSDLTGSFSKLDLKKQSWRLQQDLPTKGVKNQDVGSQIMKNILANIEYDATYGDYTGEEIISEIFNTVSEISNSGLEKLKSEFYKDGQLNKKAINDIILRNLKDADENLILALKRGVPYDALPQFRVQIMNALFAQIKKSIKPKTLGGGFIQVAPYGYENFEQRGEGVLWLKDKPGLDPPLKKNGYRGEMMISGSLLNKMIQKIKGFENNTFNDFVTYDSDGKPDYSLLFGEDGLFSSPDDLVAIGYRIPNQGLSSNDSLKVVGILPEVAGDIIIPYPQITSKTGSDYDIDKMYVMFKEYDVVTEPAELKERFGKKTTSSDQRKLSDKLIRKLSNAAGLEGGILLPKETPENYLIDLYNTVLTDEKTIKQVLSPLDSNELKSDIDELLGDSTQGNVFDAVDNLVLKHQLKSGKANVGITANHLVNVVYSQIAKSSINEDLGVGHLKADGTTALYEYKDVEGKNFITKTISNFLSAFVDIAKDPYIVRANYNTKTTGVAFMLLRAGATPKWTTRFLLQPAIVDLIKEMEIQDAKIAGYIKKSDNPEQQIKARILQKAREDGVNETEIKKAEEWYNKKISIEDSVKLLRKNYNSHEQLEKQLKNPDYKNQLIFLKLFTHYNELSKQLSLANTIMKSDVNGAGKDYAELHALENSIKLALNANKISNIQEIFNFTQVGVFYENAVGFANEIMGDLFSVTKMTPTVNAIGYGLGKNAINNSEDIINIQRSLYTYYYHTGGIVKTEQEQRKLFDAASGVARRVEAYRSRFPGKNFLIDNLYSEFYSNRVGFVKMPNSVKSGPDFRKNIYKAWLELLKSPDQLERKLGEDLIHYGFYASGFQKQMGSIFDYAPHDYFFKIGYIKDINSKLTDLDHFDADAYDYFFRSNVLDNSVVKTISTIDKADGTNAETIIKQRKQESLKFKTIPGISINNAIILSEEEAIIESNGAVRPYVKRKDGGRIKLYKLEAIKDGEYIYVAASPYVYEENGNKIFVFSNVYENNEFISDWEGNRASELSKQILSYIGDLSLTDVFQYLNPLDATFNIDLSVEQLKYNPQNTNRIETFGEKSKRNPRILRKTFDKIKNQPVFGNKEINTMRKSGIGEWQTEQFGNPFSGSNVYGTIHVSELSKKELLENEEEHKKAIADAVKAYENFIVSGVLPETLSPEIRESLYKNRDWVIDQLTDPNSLLQSSLNNGDRFIYMKSKLEYFSHADLLLELVNKIEQDQSFSDQLRLTMGYRKDDNNMLTDEEKAMIEWQNKNCNPK